MADPLEPDDGRSTAEKVFEVLLKRIMTLALVPGSRISEAQIAAEFSVSRQPVREAFSRLGTLDLVEIRPQRGTTVKLFSTEAILQSRFLRLAIELELVERAALAWDNRFDDEFENLLAQQESARQDGRTRDFYELDANFHKLIAKAANSEFAESLIFEQRALIGRICMLSLSTPDEMTRLVQDHRAVFADMRAGNSDGARAAMRTHLGRMEGPISNVRAKHPEYFN